MDNKKTVREQLLDMEWPQKDSLSEIAKHIGVSRQYIHQLVNELGLPYVPGGIKKPKVCGRPGCENEPRSTNKYCDTCIHLTLWIKYTGCWYDCACGCSKRIYRTESKFKGGRNEHVFYNREHYMRWHTRNTVSTITVRKDEHTVLA